MNATLEMSNELEISIQNPANPPHSCITKEFVQAGSAIFTIECSPDFIARNPTCKPHYTFKAYRKRDIDGLKSPLFVALLTGPDNENDFQGYVGLVNEGFGRLMLTPKSRFSADSWPVKILSRCLIRIFAGEQHLIEAAGFAVRHCGKCGRCSRTLTTPESIRLSIGPECLRIIQEGGK